MAEYQPGKSPLINQKR